MLGDHNMVKRICLALIISVSIGSIALATLVAQRAARKAQPARANAGAQRRPQRKPRPTAVAQQGPVRPVDPDRAPQNLVDDALYTNEEFFGTQSSVARPYATALERVSALLQKYPRDPRLHL